MMPPLDTNVLGGQKTAEVPLELQAAGSRVMSEPSSHALHMTIAL